jgi:hypothetical protein
LPVRGFRLLGRLLVPVAAALALSACSSSSSRPSTPTIAPARTFHLTNLQPTTAVEPDRPFDLAFRIAQPSGGTLTHYRTGPGPHTGVHVIVVRTDLSTIIHRHPPIGAGGAITQPLTLPSSGTYRVLVDAYPQLAGPLRNFQLTADLRASGDFKPVPLPPFRSSQVVDGYHVTIKGAGRIKAILPTFATVTVTDRAGRPVRFVPYYGALAHAIFFRAGSLDYFHTHVCSASTVGCATVFGGTTVSGRSTKPGRLSVGILLPEAGKWRLFLQFRAGGHIITAPFTLTVR